MTITTENRRAGAYEADGVQLVYPFSFRIFEPTDIVVTVGLPETETPEEDQPTEEILTYGEDYSVTFVDGEEHGYITLTVPVEAGKLIVITSDVPALQLTHLTNKGGMFAEVLETAYDRAVVLIQQLDEKVDRAIKVGVTSSATADDYKGELEAVANQAAESASSASASAQQATTIAQQAQTDASNALALAQSSAGDASTALTQSATALADSASALASATSASSLATTADTNATDALTKAEQALTDSATALTQSSQALTDSATALEQSTTALADSETALTDSATALSNSATALEKATEAEESSQQAVTDSATALNTANQALAETSAIDTKVSDAVTEALTGIEIPGLTKDTITGALGYTPYDGETNELGFASAEGISTAVNEAVAPFDTRVGAVESDIGALETRVGTNETSIGTLTAKVGTAESDIDGLTTRVGTAESELDALEPRVATNETDIDALEGRVTTAETNITDVTTRVETLEEGGVGGTGSYVGQYIFSPIPITDATVHLADGSQLMAGGVYDDFINHIKALYKANPTASYFAQPELVDIPFEQPALTANGTMGGDAFAVEANSEYSTGYQAWKAFDGDDSTFFANTNVATNNWITFYNPEPLNVTLLTIKNRNDANQGFLTGTVYGSNDNATWTSLKNYDNGVTTAGAVWSIDLSNNSHYFKYYKIFGATSLTSGAIATITITATYKGDTYGTAEEAWQNHVARHGSCGKFVVTDEYVRLLKVSDIIQGTTDVSQCGTLLEAGLPNITGDSSNFDANVGWTGGMGTSGAFYTESLGTSGKVTGDSSTNHDWYKFGFDASRSNPIYGNSDTVQPQQIKGLLYIVVGTSAKTDIQIDIDNVLADLANKADRDLSNTSPAISFATAMNEAGIRTVVETWQSDDGTSWYRKWSDGWVEQGGVITFSAHTYQDNQTLAFPTAFANTNYSIVFTGVVIPAGKTSSGTNYIGSRTTTGVTYAVHGSPDVGTSWYACGY